MPYHCSNAWSTLFVWGNGDVTHCCYSNAGPLGNVNTTDIDSIWNGKKLAGIREKISQNDYIGAGCEQNCRPYRWNRFYGENPTIHEIPEGLGRIPQQNPGTVPKAPDSPKVVGVAMDWRCNFKCTHCQAPRNPKGLSEDNQQKVWPYLEKAQVVRFVDGEFTINKKSLENIQKISRLKKQPTVFMNTNGHISPKTYLEKIKNLQSFHLKFSLEGVGNDFEKIRIGGTWSTFHKNLLESKDLFETQSQQGKDWKLYLNCCIMKSNFHKLPEVLQFAVDNKIRMVVNPINGARHIHENISLYGHLKLTPFEIATVSTKVDNVLQGADYLFEKEFQQHFAYILDVFRDKKLNMSYPVLKFIRKYVKGQNADRLLYMAYKFSLDKRSFFIYLYRKVKKRFLYKIRSMKSKNAVKVG